MSKTLESKAFLNSVGYINKFLQKEAAKEALELAKKQDKPVKILIKKHNLN